MKLLIITSIDEYKKDICKLFKESNIEIYSTMDIEGHKLLSHKNNQDNWFSDHRETYKSKLHFSFTSENLADNILKKIENYNKEKAYQNPVKAVVLDIEKFI